MRAIAGKGIPPSPGETRSTASSGATSRTRTQGGPDSRGSFRFEYDAAHDIHIVHAHWQIETEADCREWYEQQATYFKRLRHRADAIFVMEHFRLGPAIGTVWGPYRARLASTYLRYSVRINPDPRVKVFMATSHALHGAPTDQAPTRDAALQLILRRRREAEGPL